MCSGDLRDDMKFIRDDGGRELAGFKGEVGDCVVRAIAIATDRPYGIIYDMIKEVAKKERLGKKKKRKSNPRLGVYEYTMRQILDMLGWEWIPTMFVGVGCTVHLTDGEVPMDRVIIVKLSRHLTTVKYGVIHDMHDPQESRWAGYGKRCVYGYWQRKEMSASED